MRESHMMWVMLSSTLMVFSVSVMLLYYSWQDHVYTMPLIRYQAFRDRVRYAETQWHSHMETEFNAYNCADIVYSADGMQFLQLGSFASYAQAVSYSVYLREQYGIDLQIVMYDSVSGKNMVPWYTLASHAMPPAVCDHIKRTIQQYEHINKVETCNVK